ncbi:DUF4097 family beta strand repeat-containing protein [Peribacillus sp. SCS-155]|uniref:DUF4097 family beta strand repeat-containing protein n=1 Tax=Peribacillus sedimenti TaxID=3115297 RepID=UPI0039060FC1
MKSERERILQMVQDGKLSVDEALTLLSALDKQHAGKNVEDNAYSENEDGFFGNSIGKKVTGTKSRLLDFVDAAFKKVKEADLDFNFGPYVEMEHVFQRDDALINRIQVDINNGKTSIIPWEQNGIRIECAAKIYRVENKDEAKELFLQQTHFDIQDGELRFNSKEKTMKIDATIFVPQSQYDMLDVRMFNGGIHSENIHAAKMKAKTANGHITILNHTGSHADYETGNGNIKVEQGTLEKLNAETLNGAIKIDGSFDKVDAQSFTGDISCELTGTESKYIHGKTVTGRICIHLEEGREAKGELKSNMGSLQVNLKEVIVVEEKNEVVNKLLRFETKDASMRPMHIFAETKSGSITIE